MLNSSVTWPDTVSVTLGSDITPFTSVVVSDNPIDQYSILLETGDHLLTEDNGYILLEQ